MVTLAPPLQGTATTIQNQRAFIPEIWTEEVRRQRDSSFTMLNCVRRRLPTSVSYGDIFHIPTVGRLGIRDKLPGTPVQFRSHTPGDWEMRIDKYKESSLLIEDILKVQAYKDSRAIYTQEIAYAMSQDMDNFILGQRAALPTSQWIVASSTGTVAGDPEVISEAEILLAIEKFNLAKVPQAGRMFKFGVQHLTQLLQIEKFISADYVDNQPVSTGRVGSLYGIPVEITTQITPNTLNGYQNGDDEPFEPTPGVQGSPYVPTQYETLNYLPRGKTGNEVAQPFITGGLFHMEWCFAVTKKAPRMESGRSIEYQADMLVGTQMYGAKVYREDHAVLIHTAP